jgi:rod shape-determining protein MreC
VLAILLMVADTRFKAVTDPVRFQLRGVLSPLYALSDWPSRFSAWFAENAKSDEATREENQYLKSQLLVLSGRMQKFSELAAENARLRGLIDSAQAMDGHMLIAEIVGVDIDPFRHIILLNKGRSDGVYAGQPVLDARGIMGQVTEVGPQTSYAMLISDREHALSVRVARNGIRAVLAGTGDLDHLSVQYVPESADVKVGDVLLTSGLGPRFPPGYPVATVTQVGKTGTSEFADIRAKPVAELDRNRHVLLMFTSSLHNNRGAVGSAGNGGPHGKTP